MQEGAVRAISTFEDRHSAGIRAKLEAVAWERGVSLADLIGTEVSATRASVAAQYRHPENAALTWSGVWRKPRRFCDPVNKT